MSYARQMLDSLPQALNFEVSVVAAAIDALNDCAQACVADSVADLSEPEVTGLVKCIRLCLDCVDVCGAAIGVLSRPTDSDLKATNLLLEACVAICNSCGDECDRHAQMHEHCRICAEACRCGEKVCRELLGAIK
jgi:hypothetical protein